MKELKKEEEWETPAATGKRETGSAAAVVEEEPKSVAVRRRLKRSLFNLSDIDDLRREELDSIEGSASLSASFSFVDPIIACTLGPYFKMLMG